LLSFSSPEGDARFDDKASAEELIRVAGEKERCLEQLTAIERQKLEREDAIERLQTSLESVREQEKLAADHRQQLQRACQGGELETIRRETALAQAQHDLYLAAIAQARAELEGAQQTRAEREQRELDEFFRSSELRLHQQQVQVEYEIARAQAEAEQARLRTQIVASEASIQAQRQQLETERLALAHENARKKRNGAPTPI